MAQTSFTNTLPGRYEGTIAHSRELAQIVSKIAEQTGGIPFGRILSLQNAAGTKVRLPYSKRADLTLDAALVASNVLSGNIVINGVTTAYTETYASSSAATLAALAAEIATLDGVASATVTTNDAGTADRRIRVVFDDGVDGYFSSGAVTLGASQAGVTLTNTDSFNFDGISVHEETMPDSSGNAVVLNGDAVSVARVAYIKVRSDAALNPGDSVYVRFVEEDEDDEKRGMVTNAAGSSPTKAKLWSALSVEEGCSAGGIATLRINL